MKVRRFKIISPLCEGQLFTSDAKTSEDYSTSEVFASQVYRRVSGTKMK